MGQPQCCQCEGREEVASPDPAVAETICKGISEGAPALLFAGANSVSQASGEAADGSAGQQRFSVAFEREIPHRSFGAGVDSSDLARLYISKLERGDTLVNRYNHLVSQDPSYGEPVAPGQYITEINGARGEAKQLEALLTTSVKMSVVFVKPTVYTCIVHRNGRPLGLDLRYPCNDGTSLLVKSVGEGATQALDGWTRPRPADRIISVNGTAGDCYSLLEAIKKSADTATARLELGMCRFIEG